METATAQARLIGLGILHEGLDKLEGIFDIPTLKQRARDVESARERMYLVQDSVKAAINDLGPWLANSKKRLGQLNKDINVLLEDDDPSNDTDAVILQDQYNALKAEYEKRDARLAEKQNELLQNDEAAKFLTNLLAKVKAKIEELSEAKEDTKVKEQAADAMEGAKTVVDVTAGFDTLGKRILDKNRVANQRFQRVTGSFIDATGKDEGIAQARADIAQRKALIAAKKNAA